ncbi:MAG: cupin-like domain-containing protein [Pseudomonadota bacterium]
MAMNATPLRRKDGAAGRVEDHANEDGGPSGPGGLGALGGVVIFSDGELSRFADVYPDKPLRLRHGLCDHPLLSHDALNRLAARTPNEHQEFNAGDIAVDGYDEDAIPKNGLTIAETVASIDRNRSWACLHNVEIHPAYKALVTRFHETIAPVVRPATGAVFRPEADIFVSSAGAVAPFHIDPQHNILMQICGEKTVWLYDADDDVVLPQTRHEEYHATGRANLAYDAARFKERGRPYRLLPGDALFIPVKAPHWVEVAPEGFSVSLSMTWRSAGSDRDRRVHRINHMLRRIGYGPSRPGAHPVRDMIKAEAFRVVEKIGLTSYK